MKFGDASYLKTFGLQLLSGRFYKDEDTAAEAVINQKMAAKLGLRNPIDALGKTIRIGGGKWRHIVGVVEDFKNKSLREELSPIIFTERPRYYGLTAVKLASANPGRTYHEIEKVWEAYYPNYAYVSEFLDESINNFYRQEERMSSLYKVYAVLAIILSCLGLYGLVSFMANLMTKEIGIRKLLGASVGSILYLFSKEFTVLLFIAFVLAAPVAWLLMTGWLQNFVYRIHIGIWDFLLAFIASILIAWLTVGYSSVRAALAKPVDSIRTE